MLKKHEKVVKNLPFLNFLCYNELSFYVYKKQDLKNVYIKIGAFWQVVSPVAKIVLYLCSGVMPCGKGHR